MATSGRIPTSIAIGNREMPLWTFGQLEKLNKQALRSRCMDIRDILGAERVPKAPHHDDGMRRWILMMQEEVTGITGEEFGMPTLNAQMMPVRSTPGASTPMSQASGAGYARGQLMPSMGSSEAMNARMDAQFSAQTAKNRNRGTVGLLSWDH